MRAIHLLVIVGFVMSLALPAWAQWGIMDDEVPTNKAGAQKSDEDDEDENKDKDKEEKKKDDEDEKGEDEDKNEDDEDDKNSEEEDEDNEDEESEDEDEESEDEDEESEDEDEESEDEEEDDEETDKEKDLHEDPDEKFFSVGGRIRWIMIPEWFIRMFGVSAKQGPKYRTALPLVSNVGVGPEFIYRKDGLDIVAAIWYAGLGWNPISMKDKDEPPYSYEVIENNMRAILFTANFAWSTSFQDWIALTYGLGIGFGARWGDITRTEASESSQYYRKCRGPGDPDSEGCESNGQYGLTYDKFKVFPWIEFLLGLRFKPHRHVAIYVDGGFGLGFQIGARAGYIF